MFLSLRNKIEHYFDIKSTWQASTVVHVSQFIQDLAFNILEGILAYKAAKAAAEEDEDAVFKSGLVVSVFFIHWSTKTAQAIIKVTKLKEWQRNSIAKTTLKSVIVAFPLMGLISISSAQLLALSSVESKEWCDAIRGHLLVNKSQTTQPSIRKLYQLFDQCIATVLDLDRYHCENTTILPKDPHLKYYGMRCQTFDKHQNYIEKADITGFISRRTDICDYWISTCHSLLKEKCGGTMFDDNKPSPRLLLKNETIDVINIYYQYFHQLNSTCTVPYPPAEEVQLFKLGSGALLFVAASIVSVVVVLKLRKPNKKRYDLIELSELNPT
jgi:hypothetical protein